jgi:hypothetical protein
VSCAPTSFQHLGVNTLAIVAYAQSKQVTVISNLSFDPTRTGVLEGIAQQFAGDPIDFLVEERTQPSSLALYDHAEKRTIPIRTLKDGQFLTHCRQQFCEIALSDWFGTQVPNSTPALGDCLLRSSDRAVEILHCLFGAPG